VYVIAAIGFSFLNKKSVHANIRKINISAFTQKINYWTTHYNNVILGIGGLVFIFGIISVFSVEVSTNSLDLLGKGKVKDDLEMIEETLAGSIRLQLNVSGNEASLLTREALSKLKNFQEKLSDNPLIAHPVSIVDFQTFLEDRIPTFSKINAGNFERIFKKSQDQSNAFFSLTDDDFSYL